MGKTKSLPDEMVEHFVGEFRRLIATEFTRPNGEEWTQTEIGDALDMEQGRVSDAKRGVGIGWSILIPVSRYTGRTLNDLLGPTAAPGSLRRAGPAAVAPSQIVKKKSSFTWSERDAGRGIAIAAAIPKEFVDEFIAECGDDPALHRHKAQWWANRIRQAWMSVNHARHQAIIDAAKAAKSGEEAAAKPRRRKSA